MKKLVLLSTLLLILPLKNNTASSIESINQTDLAFRSLVNGFLSDFYVGESKMVIYKADYRARQRSGNIGCTLDLIDKMTLRSVENGVYTFENINYEVLSGCYVKPVTTYKKVTINDLARELKKLFYKDVKDKIKNFDPMLTTIKWDDGAKTLRVSGDQSSRDLLYDFYNKDYFEIKFGNSGKIVVKNQLKHKGYTYKKAHNFYSHF